MPKTTITTPGVTAPDKPQETIGDAVNYVANDPSGLGYVVQAAKWLAGLVMALFKPAVKKP